MLVKNIWLNTFLWAWGAFNLFLTVISLLDGEPSLLLMTIIWIGGVGGFCYTQCARLTKLLPALKPRWRFLLLAMVMAIAEEVIVTLLGGGLGGHTDSLVVDLANTVPLFFFWSIGWWMLINRFSFTMREALWLGALHGWIFEMLYSGIAFYNPFGAILFFPMFAAVYAIILYLPLLTVQRILRQGQSTPLRLGLALALPFLIIPPIILVLVLGEAIFPSLYPF